MKFPDADLINIVVPMSGVGYAVDESLTITFTVRGPNLDHPKRFDYVIAIDGKTFSAFSNASCDNRGVVEAKSALKQLAPGLHTIEISIYRHGERHEFAKKQGTFTIAPKIEG